MILIGVILAVNVAFADDDEKETLKCLVKFLKEKGVSEEFFSSVSTSTSADCENLINVRLTKSYDKINDKLKADPELGRYSNCVMNNIKTEANKVIVLQREAIKINGVGVAVWNYFGQKEHLDNLKKKIEISINKALNEKCMS